MRRIAIALLLVAWIGEADVSAATRRRAVRHPGPTVPIPVAAADSYSLSQGSTLTVADPGVLANDTLNSASIASFGPVTGTEQTILGSTLQTAHGGSLSLSAGGGFTYTPSSTFSGTDSFHYVIRNAGGSSSAAVTFAVSATEAIAVGDSYTTEPEHDLSVPAPGVLTNDTLAGGRIVSFGATSGTEETVPGSAATARGGVIRLGQDGSFTYTPPPTVYDGYGLPLPFTGPDRFLYRIQRDTVFSTAPVNVSVELPPSGADYVITTPGHYYAISGLSGENPALQLTRGRTYTFQINASPVHPFAILDAPPGSVTNNNITQGTLTFAVPLTAASYRYRCTTHLFGNVITTVP
jgi:hypothetical protein